MIHWDLRRLRHSEKMLRPKTANMVDGPSDESRALGISGPMSQISHFGKFSFHSALNAASDKLGTLAATFQLFFLWLRLEIPIKRWRLPPAAKREMLLLSWYIPPTH